MGVMVLVWAGIVVAVAVVIVVCAMIVRDDDL